MNKKKKKNEAKWISVDKKLPPRWKTVILMDKEGHIESGFYDGYMDADDGYVFRQDGPRSRIILYVRWWMHKPKMPKEFEHPEQQWKVFREGSADIDGEE